LYFFYDLIFVIGEVGVMRVLLDHELLTLREAQRFLNVTRCAINEMIDSGKLHAITIGSQRKVAGWSVKSVLPDCLVENFNNNILNDGTYVNASDSELSMIADWT